MKLKCEKKTVISVNYSHLERYIKHHTGAEVEIPCILECGNDTDHEIDVGLCSNWINDKRQAEADAFLDGKGPCPKYDVRTILDAMHRRGLLEAGTYLIRVSW